MDLGTFHIDTLIVHGVPRRMAGEEGGRLLLSGVPSDLTEDLRNFFRERANRSLRRHAFDVERDPDTSSPVPQALARVIADQENVVSASQEMARHLYASQTGVNPAGLLVVCRGTVSNDDCCAILKLEHEEAIRVEQVDRDGELTFSVSHLRDLMLGQNTRVFKASLFTTTSGAEGLAGRVSDNQASFEAGGGVASFFLQRFLGCQLKAAPDVATREFFETTQTWINTLPDPAKRGRYEVALLAEMHSSSATVTPRSFADQHLDTADRATFRAYLDEHDAPRGRFGKDIRLIDSRIKQMSIRFASSSVRVSGNPEDIEEYVRINRPGADAAPVEILDSVKEVRGGR